MAFSNLSETPPDRFRVGDLWRGPDGRLCQVRPAPVAGHVYVVRLSDGHHALLPGTQVLGYRRQKVGGGA